MANEQLTVTQFLSAFFPDKDETIYLRKFGAKGAPGTKSKNFETTRNNLPNDNQLRRDLIEANETCGIYFVVNSGGQKDEDITRFNAFFAENDSISVIEQHQALDNAPIRPNIRVETKRSVHAYWLIDGECIEEDWRDIQERLIAYFKGDKSIKNPSRCMRLPFFDHVSFDGQDYEYKKVEIVTFDTSRRFTVNDMKAAFPLPEILPDAQNVTRCDDVTSNYTNQTFTSWEDLNAELGIRIKEQGKRNSSGKYEMRCPVHNGASETSLFFNPATKAISCTAKCPHSDILKAFGLPEKPTAEKNQTQSALLVNLTDDAELFVSQNDEPFANIFVNGHRENWAIESTTFRNWLGRKYYQTYNKVASENAVKEALSTLSGKAKFDGEKKKVYVRRAEHEDAIYLDLVNDDWQVVKITAEGWEVTSDCPIKFRRTRGMKSLPIPVKGGSLTDLDRFLNIHGDDLLLVKAWLITALKTDIPYPILVFSSQQNCGKSTSASVLCEMIDPHQANLVSKPRSEEDLFVSVSNRLVVAFDNLSFISDDFSDSLCRIATGGAFTKRKNYSDADETILSAKNPLILTGIGDIATKGDLLSRSIIIQLPTITNRTSEADFWTEFRTTQPRILGALLDAACEGLNNFPFVTVDNNQARMLDFVKFGTAAEKALGLDAGEFVQICNRNYENANNIAIENNPVALLINRLMQTRNEWSGTATELLTEIYVIADEMTRKNPAYPRSPQKLSNVLDRIAPNFRLEGIEIEKDREGGTGNRIINIRKVVSNLSHRHNSSQIEMVERTLF